MELAPSMWPPLSSPLLRLRSDVRTCCFGGLTSLCTGGFVARGALSPQTTFFPCRRSSRRLPHSLFATRRTAKRFSGQPHLTVGSTDEPGGTAGGPHQRSFDLSSR